MNTSPRIETTKSKRTRRLLVGVGLAAAVAGGGAGVVNALGGNPSSPAAATAQVAANDASTAAATPDSQPADDTTTDDSATDDSTKADRPAKVDNGETEVTGSDAESASAAALGAVAGGTVDRVTTDTDDGGAFEVHMTDADGNRVKVVLDANFAVVDTLTGGPGGPGGPGGRDNGETEVTGSDAESASAAALEAVAGGTVDRVTTDTDDGGAFEVHMTDADGNRVKVVLDANFAVVDTLTGGPGGPGGPGGRDNGETEVTGSDAESASAAALGAVAGGTVDRVTTDTDDGGAFEVHMTDADGNRVKVVLDANFAVVDTLTGGPGGPGGHDGRPDDGSDTDSTGSDAPNVVGSGTPSSAA